MKILLVYYHPIIWDIAKTLLKMGHNVEVAVNPSTKDNYGIGSDIIKEWSSWYTVLPLPAALNKIKNKSYDLVGCDGVFDGDKLVMEVCKSKDVPFFNIQGYPGVVDEPSDNILSLGWFLPAVQYLQRFPHEDARKNDDWKTIALDGQSKVKNICVFYPNMWYMSRMCDEFDWFNRSEKPVLISGVQRYKECNEWCYKVFEVVKDRLKDKFNVINLEGCSHKEFLEELKNSHGLLHLKQGDQPGISVLEAMWLKKPVITMSSFVLTSFNQDLLLDNDTAIVADSIDELVERVQKISHLRAIGEQGKIRAEDICCFHRQRDKLQRFLDRCIC